MDIFEVSGSNLHESHWEKQLGEQQINYQSATNGNIQTNNNGLSLSVSPSTQFQTFDSATSATLAPLPQSLHGPQRGYPDTASMVEFIGEAPLNTQTSSWNANPYAPNENLNQVQINGRLVEPRVGNPLWLPNITENNNYNGVNHQFPYPSPSQPNLVGTMPGITTGQSSGQFFTNQISDFSLRDAIINSQTTWNSRLPQTQTLSTMLPQNQPQTFSTSLPHNQGFSTMLPHTQTRAFSTLLPRTEALSSVLPQSQAFATLLPQTQTFPTMPHQTNYTSENPLRTFDLQSQNSIQHPMNPNSRLESYPYLQHTSAPVLTNPNVHHHGYGSMLPNPAAPSALPNPLSSNLGVQASVFGTGGSSFSSVVSPAIPSLRDDPTVNSHPQASLPNSSYRFSQPNRYQQAMMPLGHGQQDVTSVQQLLRSQSMPERNIIAPNSESQNATLRGCSSLPSSEANGSEAQNLPAGTTELTEEAPSEDSKKDEVEELLRRVRERTEKSQLEVAPSPTKGVQDKGKSPAAASSSKKPYEAIQKVINIGSSRKNIRTNSSDGSAKKVRKVSSESKKKGTKSGEEQTSPENAEKEVRSNIPNTLAPRSHGVYVRNADGVHPDPYIRAMIAQGMMPNPNEEKEEEEVPTVKHSQKKK